MPSTLIVGEVIHTNDLSKYSYATGGSAKNSNLPAGSRAVYWGGSSPTATEDTLEYFAIGTTGNSVDFGEMIEGETNGSATSDGSRGVYGGGSPNLDVIQYITITTLGNSTDYHELSEGRNELAATSNGSRGIFTGGGPPEEDTIDYIQIQPGGDAVDWGNMVTSARAHGACSNGHKAFLGGGSVPGASDKIDVLVISSLASCTDFGGELTEARHYVGGVSDGSRGVFAGGDPGRTTIDYIAMDSGADATDHGDLTQGRYLYDSCPDGSRGIWAAGYAPVNVNTIDYITIGVLGNAIDFGDISSLRNYVPGCAGG